MTQIQFWSAFTLLLLATLALAVARPTARAVKRRYRALAAQAQDMERLALVAERTSNWVVTTSPDRAIVWANQSALKGLGLALSQAVGRLLTDFVAPQGNDVQEMTLLGEELDSGLSAKMEILISGHGGQNIWLDVEYQPTHDDHGMLSGFLVLALDITERVNQRQKMVAVFNALPIGVVVQSKTGAVIDCNPATSEISGLSRDQLMGLASVSVAVGSVRDDLTEYPATELPTARNALADGEYRAFARRPGRACRRGVFDDGRDRTARATATADFSGGWRRSGHLAMEHYCRRNDVQ